MSGQAPITLDNPIFNGRLRQPVQRERPSAQYLDQMIRTPRRPSVAPVQPVSPPAEIHAEPLAAVQLPAEQPFDNEAPAPINVVKPQPFALPAQVKQQRSNVLKRQLVRLPEIPSIAANFKPPQYSRLQLCLIGMACFVFVCGMTVSLQTAQTNHNATAQVSALSKRADQQPTSSNSDAPSATKPSSQAVSQYVVAPDLPRYIKIPKLSAYGRVMQVGVNSSGTLGAPSNVFDAAWYTGSAKPGQPGATLIDGHVSSWTTHGIFYGIKDLVAGDTIQIVRGDGAVLNYQVIKTLTYNANHVDMNAAMTPVTPGKSGLNLITCTGTVKPGTSQYTQRVIVFTQQIQ